MPELGWYVDSGHGEHDALEPLGANVPGLHGVGSVAPTPQAVPAGHAMHWSAELRPVVLPCRPDGHGRAAGEPSGQYPPCSQGSGTTVARPHAWPAGQSPEHNGLDCASVVVSLPNSPALHAGGKPT